MNSNHLELHDEPKPAAEPSVELQIRSSSDPHQAPIEIITTSAQPIPNTSSAHAISEAATLVARIFIRDQVWSQFQQRFLNFLHRCQREVPGYLHVSLLLGPSDQYPDTKVVDVVHSFVSMDYMRAFMESPQRHDWLVEMRQFRADRNPELYSYSGLTGFFMLGRNLGGDVDRVVTTVDDQQDASSSITASSPTLSQSTSSETSTSSSAKPASPAPAPVITSAPILPPPKWRIGTCILAAAFIWGFFLEYTSIMKAVVTPDLASDAPRRIVTVTSLSLLPVFFIIAPLIMRVPLVRKWLISSWRAPECQQSHPWLDTLCFTPIRWVFF